MKIKKIMSLLLSLVMLASIITGVNITAEAAGWINTVTLVDFNESYVFYQSDFEIDDYIGNYQSQKGYGIQINIPDNGTITINAEAECIDCIPAYYYIYNSKNLNKTVKDVRTNGIYNSAYGMYQHSESISLSKGTYYILCVVGDWRYEQSRCDGKFELLINYKPSISKPSIKTPSTNKKHKITAKWNKVSGCNGYQVQFGTKKNFKSGVTTKTVSGQKKTSYTGKFKKGKKYYIRVRAYKTVDGKKYYGSWSKTKSIKCK